MYIQEKSKSFTAVEWKKPTKTGWMCIQQMEVEK